MACDGTRAAQDKLAQLMESHAAARTSWAAEVRAGAGFGAAGCRLCPLMVCFFFQAEGGAFGCSRGGAAGAARCEPGSQRAPADTRGALLAGRGSGQAPL